MAGVGGVGLSDLFNVFSPTGFVLASLLLGLSYFFQRWKQFVGIVTFVSLLLFSARSYRAVYAALVNAPRDARTIFKYVLTLAEFFYWKVRGGATPAIFRSIARAQPDKVAFRFGDAVWTFDQVEKKSNQVANYLQSQGIKRGDHIALLMEPRPEVVCYWLGVCKLGAVTALINTQQRGAVLSHSLRAGGCNRIICGTELAQALVEISHEWPELQVFITGPSSSEPATALRTTPLPVVDFDTAVDGAASGPPATPRSSMDSTFLLIYTSGTTGMPKAAKMSHARFFMMARALYNMAWIRRDDVIYDTLPLYHTAGGLLGVGQALLNGLTVVIRPKFSVSNFWSDCIKYDCTVAQYIGEMCRFLLAAPEKPEQRSHKVRMIFGNGMRPQIWKSFVERFNIKQVREFYGSTEGNCNMLNTENRVGAVGFLPWIAPIFNPYYLIRADPDTNEPIRDENGFCIECDYHEPGILIGVVKRSHPFSQFSGYADKKATEKKILRDVFKKGDEYFNSGDILEKDIYGYFYFKDRTGDTFRWRGENVATSEVEAVISNVIGLKDAIVYGVEVPNVEGRAGMAAVVDPDANLDLTALAAGVRKALPAYARPLFLRVLATVPLTSTFKLKKSDLQKEGFNPSMVSDPLYFFNGTTFVSLTDQLYQDIVSGKVKL